MGDTVVKTSMIRRQLQRPAVVDVWIATYTKRNGTWSVSNGAQILKNLEEASETHRGRIVAAPIPMAEHFALVFGRKPNHSCGIGIGAVNQWAQERYRIHAQAEAADERATDAQKQAAALLEVQRLTEDNMHLRGELQFQHEELNSQKKTVEGTVCGHGTFDGSEAGGKNENDDGSHGSCFISFILYQVHQPTSGFLHPKSHPYMSNRGELLTKTT
uniref:Uncharacterized protein n=1 Tax=Leersia perrieri TaxID=77586 RepID=A0A0D9XBC4_9ORYZ